MSGTEPHAGSERISRRSGLQTTELDGDVSIYDPRSDTALMLNTTASAIWRLLDGQLDLPAITAVLAEAYGQPPERIAPQVRAAVDELLRRDVVTTIAPAGGDAGPA